MKLELRHVIESDGEWWKVFKDGKLDYAFISRERAMNRFALLRDGNLKECDELIAEWEGEPGGGQ